MKIAGLPAVVLALLSLTVLGAQSPAPRTFPKHVRAWADVRNGYQHAVDPACVATRTTLGHPRELWDTEWLQKMYVEALRRSMRLP